MMRVGVETEGVFEDGIQRMRSQSELRPVQTIGQRKFSSEVVWSCDSTYIGVMMRAYNAILFRNPL